MTPSPSQPTVAPVSESPSLPAGGVKPYYEDREAGIVIYHGDCREVAPFLPAVDAVIADPPFGTTQCSWDVVIPFPEMWAMIAHFGSGIPVVLFGCEPFSSLLRCSNLRQFKYDWIWDKPKGTGFLNAKKQPMRCHETISVFCAGTPPYNPQMTSGHARKQSFRGRHLQTDVYGEMKNDYQYDSTDRYPRSVITCLSDTQNSSVHPTQKPLALMQYLIRTYTNPGQSIADFSCGSGTTLLAAKLEGRTAVGIETREDYCEIAANRLSQGVLNFGGVA